MKRIFEGLSWDGTKIIIATDRDRLISVDSKHADQLTFCPLDEEGARWAVEWKGLRSPMREVDPHNSNGPVR